jgi:hypothetical protein
MSMSRKNYVEAAEIVAAARARFTQDSGDAGDAAAREMIDYFETELARMFAADNVRFDARRFFAACNAEVRD